MDEKMTQDFNHTQYYSDLTQITAVRYVCVLIYGVISFCAVLGNGLVLATVFRQKKIRTSVNLLVCNLAVSDLLVGAFVAPAKVIELTAPSDYRLFGSGLCTGLQFTQSFTIFSTIFILVVVAAERFFVIVHPLQSRKNATSCRMRGFLAISWISAAVLSSPNLIQARYVEVHLSSEWGPMDRAGCLDDFEVIHVRFRQVYYLFLFFAIYLVPAGFISYVSARVARVLFTEEVHLDCLSGDAFCKQSENRKKVALMMIVVNVAFIVCWSPYFLVTMVTEYVYNFFHEGNFYFTMLLINACGFVCSALNPLIYLMAPRFRRNFMSTFHAVFHLGRQPSTGLRQTRSRLPSLTPSSYSVATYCTSIDRHSVRRRGRRSLRRSRRRSHPGSLSSCQVSSTVHLSNKDSSGRHVHYLTVDYKENDIQVCVRSQSTHHLDEFASRDERNSLIRSSSDTSC